ncbi:hypothetical protein NXF25_009644 [Crotalus adamanteus]|uniref:Uncharacterized protein n=1 Tax=Crotalus adamanteus TaxID=8729 RepID=A0AAW1BR01_CROAD
MTQPVYKEPRPNW